jgi:release factor glutamine methyltransferase
VTLVPAAPDEGARLGRSAGEALRRAAELLRAAGCGTPRLDAEVLLAHVTGRSRESLLARPEGALTAGEDLAYEEAVVRRAGGWPLAYITGRREFFSLDLEVGPGVLIPRPETELLVEVAVALASPPVARSGPGLVLADIGTGSGAVAVALASLLPGVVIYATDTSEAALEVAERNVKRLGLGGRVRLRRGDLLDALPVPVDGVVANLPYVADPDWEGLPREVRDFEPPGSLRGGPDGLDLFRRLAAGLPAYLLPGGFVCLEVGPGQAGPVARLLLETGVFETVARHLDLAGHERVVSARSGESAARSGGSATRSGAPATRPGAPATRSGAPGRY